MNYKQDMPPSGGYAPIIYQRIPLKPGMNAALKVAMFFGVSGLGWVGFHYTKNKLNNETLEMRCAKQAIQPMILAEFDRLFLKQIRKNREKEEELMKDVKGWEVGKWKHNPVYLTLGPDEFFKPNAHEYFAHTNLDVLYNINNIRHVK